MSQHQAWHAWTFQPGVVAALVLAALTYGVGLGSLWRGRALGRGIPVWRGAAFGVGLLAVAAALMSPLDAVAEHLLSVHMAQHLLLVVVAAPLLVLGMPVLAMSRAAPAGWRRAVRGWHGSAPVRAALRALTHPVTAWMVAAAVLWIWHVPSLYDAALTDPLVHVLEHVTFLGSALLFWWVALQPSGPRRLARGADVLFVFAGAVQSGALGALMVFASSPLYPRYARAASAWGASPLADQQLAGLLMWVPSFVVYLVAAGALFVAWLRAVERQTRRAEERRRLVLPTPTEMHGGV